jgi:dipeptidyl aminopeptidase/acylaminoacyl peptidase
MGRYLLLCLSMAVASWAMAVETYAFVERDTTLHLDLYAPEGPANGYTVVHVFGGGFVSGARNRQWDVDYCHLLAIRGYRVASIDYRLGLRGVTNVGITNIAPLENAFYMAVEDCSAAVRFLVEHASELEIDPNKIILEGLSAGGITVLMTDFGRCNQLPYTTELPKGWKPAAIVAYSGAIYSTYGCLKWAQKPAPTLLFHGTVDKIVPYNQITLLPRGLYGSSAIAKRLKKFDFPYCIYRCEGLGHEVSMAGTRTIDELDFFVRQRLTEGRDLFMDITFRDAVIHPSVWTNMTIRDLYKK